MSNPDRSLEFVRIRDILPTDSNDIVSISTTGRCICGVMIDLVNSVRDIRAGSKSSAVSVIESESGVAGVVVISLSGRLTPKFGITIAIRSGVDAGAALSLVTNVMTTVVRQHYGRGWLVCDAPESDPSTSHRMTSNNWLQTMTNRGGMRRYVLPIGDSNATEEQDT